MNPSCFKDVLSFQSWCASQNFIPIDQMFAPFVACMNVQANPVTPTYPFTHPRTHPPKHKLFHYLSSPSKSFNWKESPAWYSSGSERPLKTLTHHLPISLSAYTLLLRPCGLLELSPTASPGLCDFGDAQSASVFRMCLPDCPLSHKDVFLGSSIRQLRGLKKATSINMHAAKKRPPVWSDDSACRQKEKMKKYISMCIYTYMSVSIHFGLHRHKAGL